MKIIRKTISLILVICTLLLLTIACNDDKKKPNNDNKNNNTEENTMGSIEAVLKETHTKTLVDFSSEALLQNNTGIKDLVKIKNGKPVLTYEIDKKNYDIPTASKRQCLTVYLPEPVDISDCHSITVTLYSEGTADASFYIYLKNCVSPIEIRLDFTGEKTFEMLTDAISVANPYPQINRMELVPSSGTEDATVYIVGISAHRKEFELSVPSGVDLSNSEIYNKIITNYREYLIGNKETQSLAAYQSKIASVNSNCKASWDSFKATYENAVEKKNFLFDIDMRLGTNGYEYVSWDEEKTYQIYGKITPMALAYAYEGSEYYQNAELLSDILKALDYCYDVFYGQCVVDNGTKGNWWPWDIGCPMQLLPTLVYIEDAVTTEQIRKYLTAYDYLMPFPCGTGANLCDMAVSVIIAGALERDAYKICQAEYFCYSLFDYVTMDKTGAGVDGGFFTDGSFIQHSVTPYAGSYGVVLVETLPKMINITNGTYFAFKDAKLSNSFAWMFDTYKALMYNGNFMGGHLGRGIGGSETGVFNRIAKSMITMLPYCPSDMLSSFKSLVRTLMKEAGQSFYDSVPLIYSTMAQELYNDDSVPLIEDYNVTKVFGNMSRVSQHTPKYGVSIALSSKRIDKYESINGANFTGWYHGDGMIYIYTGKNDYDGSYIYYANPYHVPGTTVNSSKRLRGNIHPTIPNKYNYAGGAEQGEYGAIGYILGYDYSTSRGTFLEGEEASKIEAKKSYFLFDNEIVCIGTGITDSSETTVETIVENRKWRDGDKLYINGEEISESSLHVTNILTPNSGKEQSYWSGMDHPASEILTSDYLEAVYNVRTMYFTNMGGYVFLRTAEQVGATLTYGKTNITGDSVSGTISSYTSKDTKSFLEITINHGTGNGELNGKYAYVYLPSASVEETNAYNENPDVKILAMTEKAHAVYEKTLGIVALNVFDENGATVKVNEAGSPVSMIEAETVCSLMIKKDEQGRTLISATDPSQEYRQIVFKVYADGLSELAETNERVSVKFSSEEGYAEITVNCDGLYGSTVDILLK